MSINPAQTYRVRELTLTRGDIKIYLTEGLLSFASPVNGQCVAAVFTTEGVEAGDAEVLLLPNRASERASLAMFAKTPNLDEHFTGALFVFSDDTARELLEQIQDHPLHPAPESASNLAKLVNPLLGQFTAQMDVRLVGALLDSHKPEDGFFYSFLLGQHLGQFELSYDPGEFEPISAGKSVLGKDGSPVLQLWTSFRPRHAAPYIPPLARIQDYRMETTVEPDLSIKVRAKFNVKVTRDGGRVIALSLSHRLVVASALLDGTRAEIFQHNPDAYTQQKVADTFLVIAPSALAAGTEHTVQLEYQGSVIRQTGSGEYFVDDRNAWYPSISPTMANFDLTFHCPKQLRLVATGEPVSDDVSGEVRTVRRQTREPVPIAGFNLGDFEKTTMEQGPYRIDCFAEKTESAQLGPDLLNEAAKTLDYYTQEWKAIPWHTLSITPIAGYFGQGFPGLIYLSSMSYIRPENRPPALRNPRMDSFFSELLLPHEMAHQWWGNMVRPADYRSAWLAEAMANDSALQFLGHEKGPEVPKQLLMAFRKDLTYEDKGSSVESAGPVDFGERILEASGPARWHFVTYEKGAWILQMLRQRLGDEGYRQMQRRLLSEYSTKPVTNDEFRSLASEFVPPGQPDRTLTLFFDTWVYGTGIPKIKLERSGGQVDLDVSGVDDDFTADIPLACLSGSGSQIAHWVRISSGSNPIEAASGVKDCQLPSPAGFLYVQ